MRRTQKTIPRKKKRDRDTLDLQTAEAARQEAEQIRRAAYFEAQFRSSEAPEGKKEAAQPADMRNTFINFAKLAMLDVHKAKANIPDLEGICRQNIEGHTPAAGFYTSPGVAEMVRDPTAFKGLPFKLATELRREIFFVGPEFAQWFMKCGPHLENLCPVSKSIVGYSVTSAHVKGVRALIMADANAAHTLRGTKQPLPLLHDILRALVNIKRQEFIAPHEILMMIAQHLNTGLDANGNKM